MITTNRKNVINLGSTTYNEYVRQINDAIDNRFSVDTTKSIGKIDEIAIAKKLFGKDFDMSVCNNTYKEKCNANIMPTKTTMDIYNYFIETNKQDKVKVAIKI